MTYQTTNSMPDRAPKGMATIHIPSGKSFTLHINVLSEKCEYFRAALAGNFLEARTKELTLSDVTDNTFGFFLKWVYGNTIKPDENPNFCALHNETALDLPGLFDLWFFADFLMAPSLQNHVVTNIVEKLRNLSAKLLSLQPSHMKEDSAILKDINNVVRQLWNPKGRTDQGELAKPLRELLLDVVGNPRFMTKARADKLFKLLPAAFVREFGLRTLERSASVVRWTDVLNVGIGDDGSEDGYDSDYGFERIMEKAEISADVGAHLDEIWEVVPSKYFVTKDRKK